MEICQPTAKSPLLGLAFPVVRTGVSDCSTGTGILNEFQVKGSGSLNEYRNPSCFLSEPESKVLDPEAQAESWDGNHFQ